MTAIRHRYNYANVVLDPKVVFGNKCIIGNSLGVLNHGEITYKRLLDFMELEEVLDDTENLVVIDSIVAYTPGWWGDDDWRDIKSKRIRGYLNGDCLYVVTDKGHIIEEE